MDCPKMQAAVEMRDRSGKRSELEASGGVTLETIRSIALTGVDRIAVGAITHSAPALDIGMDIET
jgi:nicotinate-nucleotide pyrophosphorylase (carboxylating)